MVGTMRIALIGQSAFGEAVLRALAENGADDIVGVFCPPDREGRPVDPIKSAASELKVDVFQPRRMRSKKAIEEFRSLDADLCVMAFVTDFVPSKILEAPRHGTIQYHPSLLPKHRGPSSINWPIIFGETETGLTIFWPDDGLDTGPILLQKRIPIGPDDTLGSLYFGQLFSLGVEAMVESVDLVRRGDAPRIEQDETQATYEGWCKDEDSQIDWQRSAEQVYNLVRGSNPRPGAHTPIMAKCSGCSTPSYCPQARISNPGRDLSVGRRVRGGGKRRPAACQAGTGPWPTQGGSRGVVENGWITGRGSARTLIPGPRSRVAVWASSRMNQAAFWRV